MQTARYLSPLLLGHRLLYNLRLDHAVPPLAQEYPVDAEAAVRLHLGTLGGGGGLDGCLGQQMGGRDVPRPTEDAVVALLGALFRIRLGLDRIAEAVQPTLALDALYDKVALVVGLEAVGASRVRCAGPTLAEKQKFFCFTMSSCFSDKIKGTNYSFLLRNSVNCV